MRKSFEVKKRNSKKIFGQNFFETIFQIQNQLIIRILMNFFIFQNLKTLDKKILSF